MDHKVNTELKNEHGKPIYPKWVSDKNQKRVLVNNPEHEAEVTGVMVGKEDKKENKKEEDKKKDNSKTSNWN